MGWIWPSNISKDAVLLIEPKASWPVRRRRVRSGAFFYAQDRDIHPVAQAAAAIDDDAIIINVRHSVINYRERRCSPQPPTVAGKSRGRKFRIFDAVLTRFTSS
jgi:hypothetical protein